MNSSIRILHNKKVNMSDEEWLAFENICQSYNRPNFEGKDLFKDLFETDKKGNIVFIKAPVNQTSMEIFLFVCALYQHQGRRIMEAEEAARLKELEARFDAKLTELTARFENKNSTVV